MQCRSAVPGLIEPLTATSSSGSTDNPANSSAVPNCNKGFVAGRIDSYGARPLPSCHNSPPAIPFHILSHGEITKENIIAIINLALSSADAIFREEQFSYRYAKYRDISTSTFAVPGRNHQFTNNHLRLVGARYGGDSNIRYA